MLTEGPTPEPRCKLIISSFLTLPHLLDYFFCTRNAMSIVLLLQMMGDGIGGGWLIYIRVWVGEQGTVIIFFFFFFFLCFCILLLHILSAFISVARR